MAGSAFAAGIISSGFSASTGLNIQSPIPQSRRCSTCGLDEDECSCRQAGINPRSIASWIFGSGTGVAIAGGAAVIGAAPVAAVLAGIAAAAAAAVATAPPSASTPAAAPPMPARASATATAARRAPASAPAPAIPAQAAPNTTQLTIKDLFSMTSMTYPEPTDGDEDDDQPMTVHLYMLKKNITMTLEVTSNSDISDVRQQAASKLGLATRQRLMLIYNGTQLDDHQEIKDLGIRSGCKIFCMKCSPGEQMGIFELDPSNLDPAFDYDFTHESDDGRTYRRGGHVYQRPYGWKRYAVKVHGEYEDDTWLGRDGIRTESSRGEWAVSYHGTEKRCVRPILDEGYKIGHRARFGKAVYSSPNLEKIDEYKYVKTFTKDGKRYKFALQNRVDPNHLTVIPPEKTGFSDFPYWLSPMQDPERGVYHVRPYGILTKELP